MVTVVLESFDLDQLILAKKVVRIFLHWFYWLLHPCALKVHMVQPFYYPIILILCSCMSYNSGIILAKIVTYYS